MPLVIPDLADKRVLITGASTGIGAALARAFAAQGARVAVHYNESREAAETLAAEIGPAAVPVQGDVGDPDATRRVVAEAAAALGGLDGLVNNAGGMLGRVPLADLSDEHYDRVMDVNARSIVVASQAALPHLKQRGGFVIHTSSIAARHGGGAGSALYAASKGFVSTITKGMAKEFIPFGIRVNAVSPGVIATPFHERWSTPAQIEAAVKQIPQGRTGTPEDCVGAYLFLASDRLSGYVIGQVIEVNGGQLMP